MRTTSNPTKEEVRKRMLDSGRWKEGPDGSLIRVQAGVPTLERTRELERLDRPMTEQEAREYVLRSFDPTAGPNVLFSLLSGAHPAAAAVDIAGQALSLGARGGAQVLAPLAKHAIIPGEWKGIVDRANELLTEGLGIKKGDLDVRLTAHEIDPLSPSFPNFKVDVEIGGKKTGTMDFGPITDSDAAYIQRGRRALQGDDVELEYGLIRDNDYPFGYDREGELLGQGYSGEMTEALNQALKEKGYRLYSSDVHTTDGHARYMNLVEKGRVEPIMGQRKINLSDVPEIRVQQERIFMDAGGQRIGDDIYIPEDRFRYNREGGRVADEWPPDNDIYDRDQQIAYANMLQGLAAEYDKMQRLQNPGFELRAGTPTLSTDMYPSVSAVEKSPELREERGRANPGFQVLDLLTPVGDANVIAQGIGSLLGGDFASGGVEIGAGLLSLIGPGSIRTGKASEKLAKGAGSKGVSVKAIKQAAAGKDVSTSEASLLNMLAERAENAGMTHVDPGNMQTGGLSRHPRFGSSTERWDEFFGLDHLMKLDETEMALHRGNYFEDMDPALRSARKAIVGDSKPILLKGDNAIYGTPSGKHFSVNAGRKGEKGINPVPEGIHAHVRAVPDPWETVKAQRGEPSRNVRTMLEIQSDAFQNQSKARRKWEDTLDTGDEPITGSPEMHRLTAEAPDEVDTIFENIDFVGRQVLGYLADKGFKKGVPIRDVIPIAKVDPGGRRALGRKAGLLNEYGGAGVAAPEGVDAGFNKLLQELIDTGKITRKEADDFLVGYNRYQGEGHYDWNFETMGTAEEVRNKRVSMGDEFDMEAEIPNVDGAHPWVMNIYDFVDNGLDGMRRDLESSGFVNHVNSIKDLPEQIGKSPFANTWEREALAAFFEDGASKGAEAYRIPTPETVRTIQNWPADAADFDMILGRYSGLPDVMKKMGVDVSQITPVTDGFGNTWLEIPRTAVPASVKVFNFGGKIKAKKKKSKSFRLKKSI